VSDPARVVVGVDGSACSRMALKFALADAARRDAEIQVVSVVQSPTYWPVGIGLASSSAGTPAADEILSQVEQETQTIVAEVVAELGESAARIPVHVQTLLGTPAGVLIEQAYGADLLVVGHRGRVASPAPSWGRSACTARCTPPALSPSLGRRPSAPRNSRVPPGSLPARRPWPESRSRSFADPSLVTAEPAGRPVAEDQLAAGRGAQYVTLGHDSDHLAVIGLHGPSGSASRASGPRRRPKRCRRPRRR
jgi:nucleotide-binding universal stress UspA family protein